ncbi:hypothetical protein TRP8649_03642 [Pelagimonas phthalicica]|uniref:Uncharacterized protein n=1 Tax=Pelagimonas phthalicica TaxID=1037362 RepID=A0A238JI61_9RHOB|nr:hypothetical protein TRP8649_03642 [Pelagimonas phthalicica]
MRAAVVIELYPCTNCAAGMCKAQKSLSKHTLLFQRPDQSFHRVVLLWAVWVYELLLEAKTFDQSRVLARYTNQPFVTSQKKGHLYFAQRTKARDESMLKGECSSNRLSGSRQVPSKQFEAVAVHNQGNRTPAVLATPHACKVSGPTFIRFLRDRW